MNRGWLTSALVLLPVLAPSGPEGDGGPGAAPPDSLPSLVFTQVPAGAPIAAPAPGAAGRLRAGWGEGSRLVRWDPDGTLTELSAGFAAAAEPDVSFDGERILFAGKRAPADPWNVWEMRSDGTELRQVTRDAGNCRHPLYLATIYVITDAAPTLHLGFVSDLAGEWTEEGTGPATHLYTCLPDGKRVRRLTHGPGGEFDPVLLDDGLIVCAAWQRRDILRGEAGPVSLFALNVDGADFALYCGGEARVRHMPAQTRGGEVVFVEADDGVPADGAGRLAAVSTLRPFHSYRRLPASEGWLYHSPAPLADGSLFVARRPADGSGTHGLVRLDPRTGAASAIFDDPGRHDFHACALEPRARPDGRSTSVTEEHATGKLYCLDAHSTNLVPGGRFPVGTIRAVRLIEAVPATGPGAPVVHRVLGVAPVASDGSFQVEIPANMPLQLQALDEDGLALATCGWTWVKNREWRGCIGCHEDPELVPENRLVQAVREPAGKLLAPPAERRALSFVRDVAPLLAARCATCHDGEARLDLTPGPDGREERIYDALLAPREGGSYVRPGRARTSPLVWRLFGRNTARPGDAEHRPGGQHVEHMPLGREDLSPDELRILVEWVDLGAPWDAPGGSAAPGTSGSPAGEGEGPE
ncbi:MAG: hypothetical protein AB1726_14170 [Planctomycetota bacterium]